MHQTVRSENNPDSGWDAQSLATFLCNSLLDEHTPSAARVIENVIHGPKEFNGMSIVKLDGSSDLLMAKKVKRLLATDVFILQRPAWVICKRMDPTSAASPVRVTVVRSDPGAMLIKQASIEWMATSPIDQVVMERYIGTLGGYIMTQPKLPIQRA